jgi:tetratricopeptide (TPR) repeat protein
VIVIVFKDQKSYDPYKPRFNGKTVAVGGYFLGGQDVNYITLATDSRGDDFQTVYHEYTHLLLHKIPNIPLWMDEGLAEYFSTFDAAGTTARFGRPLVQHVALLQEQRMPLLELFAVQHDSATYNTGRKRDLFYAQSWILVHDALIDNPSRWKQLAQFNALVQNGKPLADAFQQAVGSEPSVVEQELQALMRRPTMQYQVVTLDDRLSTRIANEPASLSEAEWNARLGDLLAHAGREDEATVLLERALMASPDLPLAHSATALMLIRHNKFPDAKQHLEVAAASSSADEFVLLEYGSTILNEQPDANGDALKKAVAALERAVQLRDGFAEAEKALGYAYLLQNEQQKALAALQRALKDDPADQHTVLLIADTELRLGRLADARQQLGPLVGHATDPAVRDRARRLLAESAALERVPPTSATDTASGTAAVNEPAADARPAQNGPPKYMPALRQLQPGETRTYGVFTQIDCMPQQVVLHVSAGGRTLLLHAPRFDAIDFISYRTNTPGSISCGLRRPPETVYVTWRAESSGDQQGVAVAVELLPDGFVPSP